MSSSPRFGAILCCRKPVTGKVRVSDWGRRVESKMRLVGETGDCPIEKRQYQWYCLWWASLEWVVITETVESSWAKLIDESCRTFLAGVVGRSLQDVGLEAGEMRRMRHSQRQSRGKECDRWLFSCRGDCGRLDVRWWLIIHMNQSSSWLGMICRGFG